MKTWWLVLMSRSSRDSATGLGNSATSPTGDLFEVRISDLPARPARPARPVSSSYTVVPWARGGQAWPRPHRRGRAYL